MDPTRLMTLACTVTPMGVTTRDEYNDDVLSAGTPVSTSCFLHQTQRGENTAGVNVAEQMFTLYLPPSVAVDANDQVTVGADTFEVIGPPWKAWHPAEQTYTHQELTVRKVA